MAGGSQAALLACVVLALAIACYAVPTSVRHRRVESGLRDTFGFDYLHLVQEWPGSFCDTKLGCKWPTVQPTTGWLLHGLWPEFKNGSWPQYCDPSAPFNMSTIVDLLAELGTYWPSLVSPDQSAFWNHEWTRHGTCAEKLTPREHDYFRLVLNLREQFDAYSVLSAAGILPGNTTTWRDAKAALDGAARFQVEVGCNIDSKNRLQLYEVRSCYVPVSSGVVAPMDCPNAASAVSCGSPTTPLLLPPFRPTAH